MSFALPPRERVCQVARGRAASAVTVTRTPQANIVGRTPHTAMIEPPTSIPAETPALTTTVWPDSRVRRTAPVLDVVIAAFTAVIPTTRLPAPMAALTAIAIGRGSSAIAIQATPLVAQPALASAAVEKRRTNRIATKVPSTLPTPYPLIPIA